MAAAGTINIAILLCEHSLDPDGSRWGGYGGIIQKWLESRPSLRERAEIKIWDVKTRGDYPAEDEYDVVLVTGATNAQSQEPWVRRLSEFITNIVENEPSKKIVGLCFGFQLLAMVHGFDVEPNEKGWENAETVVHLTPTGQELFGQQTICLNQSHSWKVTGDIPAAQNIGHTENSEVQGLYIPGRVWALQAHPEFGKEAMAAVLELEKNILTEQEYNDAVSRNTGRAEQKVAVDSVAKFILSS